jgi:uncharacterized protein (DUF1330 family)
MPAYVIVEITIHNAKRYEDYKKLTPASLEAFEGKFVVRGGKTESLESNWSPERMVVLQFPNMDKAKAWWNSDLYAPAKKLRQETAFTKMLVVEGI